MHSHIPNNSNLMFRIRQKMDAAGIISWKTDMPVEILFLSIRCHKPAQIPQICIILNRIRFKSAAMSYPLFVKITIILCKIIFQNLNSFHNVLYLQGNTCFFQPLQSIVIFSKHLKFFRVTLLIITFLLQNPLYQCINHIYTCKNTLLIWQFQQI